MKLRKGSVVTYLPDGTETNVDILMGGASQEQVDQIAEAVAGKQDAIDDLDTLRSGAAAGATALQNVPLANGTTAGGVWAYNYNSDYGINIVNDSGRDGCLRLNPCSESRIDSRTGRLPITPPLLDYAVKSALCDGKGAAYTAAEQAAARARIGAAYDSDWKNVETITIDSDEPMIVTRNSLPDGTPYDFAEIRYIIYFDDAGSVGNYGLVSLMNGSNKKMMMCEHGASTNVSKSAYAFGSYSIRNILPCVYSRFASAGSGTHTLYQRDMREISMWGSAGRVGSITFPPIAGKCTILIMAKE